MHKGTLTEGQQEALSSRSAFVLGSDGELVFASPIFCESFGFAAEDLVGTRAPFPWWPPDEEQFYTKVQNAIFDGVAEYLGGRTMQGTARRSDGSIVRVDTSYEILYDAESDGWLVFDIAATTQGADWHHLRQIASLAAEILTHLEQLGFPIRSTEVGASPPRSALSPRECEVLAYVLEGARTPEIATTLHISPHTVKNHMKALFTKLGVHSQVELVHQFGGTRRLRPARALRRGATTRAPA